MYEYDPIGNPGHAGRALPAGRRPDAPRYRRVQGNRKNEWFTATAGPWYVYAANAVNEYDTRTLDRSSMNPPQPPVVESFDYDDDGNMTQDGTFDYAWDAENRLHSVQTRLDLGADPDDPDSGDKRLEYQYDYMNRRVEKSYAVYNGSTWVVQSGFPQRYVYDGWNVVLTLNGGASNALVRKSTWGLDLSGTLHGAGGIGGLLANSEPSGETWNAYWYFYDGNGNVTQIIQPPSGIGMMMGGGGGGGPPS